LALVIGVTRADGARGRDRPTRMRQGFDEIERHGW